VNRTARSRFSASGRRDPSLSQGPQRLLAEVGEYGQTDECIRAGQICLSPRSMPSSSQRRCPLLRQAGLAEYEATARITKGKYPSSSQASRMMAEQKGATVSR